MQYINLRNYSENSILNAPIRIPQLIEKATEEKQKAVALTDTTSYGMITFYKECLSKNVKPLFGINSKTQGGLHNFIMFPTSEKGKINMFNLGTDFITEHASSLSAFKEKKEKLEDVIFIINYDSFIQFPLYEEIVKEGYIKKENFYIELQPRNTENHYNNAKELIGLENIIITSPVFYLEKEEQENLALMKALENGGTLGDVNVEAFEGLHFKSTDEIKSDFKYIKEDEFEQIVKNINYIVDSINFELDLETYQIPFFQIEGEEWEIYKKNEDYLKATKSDEWYLRYLAYKNLGYRYKEISDEFDINIETALLLSHKEFDVKLEKKLSEYSIPELKQFSKEHWSKEKQKWYNEKSKTVQDYIDRIEYEFFVIHKMGFNSYLLMVGDYIIWARNNGDLVGPGRGSAAGSIVTFLTGITDIDPIKWGLLFERFLNSSRLSMPDIDTDFSDRDNVINYCVNKYGEDKVTPIITFGKLTSKTVLKGVGKAYGINFQEMNRLTNLITLKESTGHVPLEKIYEENQEFADAINKSNEIINVFEKSKKIENFKQQTGTHACAVIIAPEPMTNYMPLQYPVNNKGVLDKSGNFVTQLEGPDAEALGLLKMDFLGLKNLTIINDCLKIVKSHKGIEENMTKVNVENDEVYEKIFHSGRTTNIFQFESPGMKKYLKGLKPNTLEDLIAMVSLYRPGPLAFIPSFINRKHGIEKVEYMTPELKKTLLELDHTEKEIEEQKELLEKHLKGILDVSYGIAVYQEQLMFMAQYMAGFSLGEADLLRRAIGKKKIKIIKEQRGVFIERAKELGYLPEVTGYIYDSTILPAANYSFNKSHAACYAFIAYQGAYLKTFYPAEYTTAILMTQGTDLDRVKVAIEDALIDGIDIVPVDINISDVEYKYVSDIKIKMGLKVIKGVGESVLNDIVKIREDGGKFENFDDFLKRTKKVLNSKVLTGLIGSGALDSLIEQNLGIENIKTMLEFKKSSKKIISTQSNMFEFFPIEQETDNSSNLIELKPAKEESTPISRAFNEFAFQGFMLKNHPFDGVKTFLEKFEINRETLKWTKSLKYLNKESTKVKGFGILTDIRITSTKEKKKKLSVKILGTDYWINGSISEKYMHKYEYELIGKDKKAPVGIGKMIEYSGNYYSFQGHRGISIKDFKFKDINQMYKVAKSQNKYIEGEKCSWKEIYLYRNAIIDTVNPTIVIVSDFLLNKDKIEAYREKQLKIKNYLLKHQKLNGEFHIILKTFGGVFLADTKLCINQDSIGGLVNLIERESGLSIQVKYNDEAERYEIK